MEYEQDSNGENFKGFDIYWRLVQRIFNYKRMNSINFSRGDILKALHRALKEGYHYIIYYEGYTNIDFIGGMITHDDNSLNEEMESNHFKQLNEKGQKYKVTYDSSYLVRAKLIKPETWGPFLKVGELTADGIHFVESVINDLPEETFANYYRRNKLLNNNRSRDSKPGNVEM